MFKISPKKFCYLISFVTLSLWIEVATANPQDLIAPYPYSKIVQSESVRVTDFSIALGAMRKVRSVWSPEVERRVNGELQKQTLQIDEGHSAKDVFEFYRSRIDSADARELFVCFERACGSSNSWANDYYGIKELYGSDGEQYFSVYEIVDEEDHLNYLSFYSVARGNKRVFTHIEWVRTQLASDSAAPTTPKLVLEQLLDRGYYIMSGMTIDNGTVSVKVDHMGALVSALNLRRSLKIRIVGHDYLDGELSEQQERSSEYAKQLEQQLLDAGISENRLEVYGVGSLAPARSGTKQRARLELVLF